MSKGVAENSRSGFSEKIGGEVEDKEEENNEKEEEGGKTSGKGVFERNIHLFSLLLSKEYQEYQEKSDDDNKKHQNLICIFKSKRVYQNL